jgi:glyoxylase-like metal-dependent hydrolase (beta-lactamase superfamily II)
MRARRTFLELIGRYGAPPETTALLEQVWSMGDDLGEDLRATRGLETVADGARLVLGGVELVAVATPGHSPGHLCYVAHELRAVFCGDLLLADITANPLPHFDDAAPRGRLASLALYLDSLARIESFGALTGYPGHGEPLPDTAAAARRAREHILARNEKVLRLVRRYEGRALFELARKFFLEDSVVGQALAFCELLAHVDLLAERGLAIMGDNDGRVRVTQRGSEAASPAPDQGGRP